MAKSEEQFPLFAPRYSLGSSMKWILSVLLVALAVGANACAQGCDAVLKHGIVVTIVDGTTGNPIEGEVTVTVTDGSYSENVNPPFFPPGARTAVLAAERPGTYRVEVQAVGYLPWVMSSVHVSRDDCHVETVALTARLTRVSAVTLSEAKGRSSP